MSCIVNYPDTEFGLLWLERREYYRTGSGKCFRCVTLTCEEDGEPRAYLVLEHEAEGYLTESEDEDVAYYADEQDGVYFILETICSCGVEYVAKDEGGKKMTEKKTMDVKVPEGTKTVTLDIERRSKRPEGMTLRQALLATPSDSAVLVRVVDSPLVDEKPLAWEMFLPAVGEDDSYERRRARTTQFASCELCDVPVLLDEREVKRVDIRYNTHGTDCVVYEVGNDA